MAFRLKARESVGKGVKRIVRRQIDNALKELSAGAGSDEAVHEARRRFKKVRALLCLVRDELGDKVYRQENTCFRDAGRPLTEVRDVKVLMEALDQLTEHFAAQVAADAFARVRQSLKTTQENLNKRVLEEEHTFAKVRELIEAARARLPEWHISHKGWSAIRRGLKRAYKEGCAGLAAAAVQPTPENLHEWRKQAKYFWHQLQVLEPAKPALLTELAKQVHGLTQALGDDHDLFMLRQTITAGPEWFSGDSSLEKLLGLIERRREELQAQAFRLGRPLFADKPKSFAKQIQDFWKTWRANPEAALRT